MDILHVVSNIDPRSGGPAEALRGLAAAQVRAGLRVRVVASFQAGDDLGTADELHERGVAVSLVGPVRGTLGRHSAMGNILSDAISEARACHIHGLWEEVQHRAARLAAARDVPYVIRPCGMLDPWSLAQSRLRKRVYLFLRLRRNLDRAAALHFTTPIEADLTRPLGLKAPPLVEPNGLTLGEFASPPARGSFRAAHGIPADRRVVLFLSRLHPKKGLDLLLPAFAKLPQADAELVLAGPAEDAYRASLEAEADRLGVRPRVRFVGMLKGADKLAAFTDADLFVLPSYQENFGVSVAEALAAGLPVVISDQVNIHPDVSAAGVGGVVPTRVEPLAVEMGRWLSDAERRRDAGERAKAFARERYDWDRIAERWVGHYERL